MTKKFVVSCIIAVLFINTLPFAFAMSLAATPRIFVDPASVVDETLTPGNNLVLTIRLNDVENFFAYEFKVFFSNSVVNASKAERPAGHLLEPVDPMNQFVAKWEIKNSFNATHGRLWLGFTMLSPETPRAGSGALVQITFLVVGVGSTPIVLADTKLADGSSLPIVHDRTDGFFSNVAPPPPPPPAFVYVDPASIVDPTLTPSNNFSININIINATDLLSFEFRLNYSSPVLEVLEVQEGTFLSGAGTTSILKNETNNAAGSVLFSVGLTASPGVNGSGILATLLFHVLANGTSSFPLSGIVLKDSGGQVLTWTKADGSFSNLSKIPGDINGDGLVDLLDVVEAAIRFGATPADTDKWNPDADLNQDNIINVFDLILICINFT